MAVPKTTETRCRDRAYKHCTNNPIPTSFFHAQYRLPVILQHKEICHVQKQRCRDGVICAVFVCPVSTPSCCGFWHGHPYIPVHFWKMFYLLVHYVGAAHFYIIPTLSFCDFCHCHPYIPLHIGQHNYGLSAFYHALYHVVSNSIVTDCRHDFDKKCYVHK